MHSRICWTGHWFSTVSWIYHVQLKYIQSMIWNCSKARSTDAVNQCHQKRHLHNNIMNWKCNSMKHGISHLLVLHEKCVPIAWQKQLTAAWIRNHHEWNTYEIGRKWRGFMQASNKQKAWLMKIYQSSHPIYFDLNFQWLILMIVSTVQSVYDTVCTLQNGNMQWSLWWHTCSSLIWFWCELSASERDELMGYATVICQ